MSHDLDIEELIQIAEEANRIAPGGWEQRTLMVTADNGYRRICHTGLGMVPPSKSHEQPPLAKHIATFDPPTVLRMLRRLKAVSEGENDRV